MTGAADRARSRFRSPPLASRPVVQAPVPTTRLAVDPRATHVQRPRARFSASRPGRCVHLPGCAVPHGCLGSALSYDVGQERAELGETEGLMKVWAVECLQECEGVAPYSIPGTEDEPSGHGRIPFGKLLIELAPTKPWHAEIGYDQIKRLVRGHGERFFSVACYYRYVPPCLESCPHVVQNMRLVVHYQHAEPFCRAPTRRVDGWCG